MLVNRKCEKMFKRIKLQIIIGLLLVVLLASSVMALLVGAADLSPWVIIKTVVNEFFMEEAFIYGTVDPIHDIVWILRLPRIVLAICIGAGLAISGIIMQAIVKNPLADPYILGVSSGASLGSTSAILLGVGVTLGENFIGIAAFLGAFTVSMLVLLVANIGGQATSIKLLLSGLVLSAICSAFSNFIIYTSSNVEGMHSITYWMMGSMAGAKWSTIALIFPLICICIAFFWSQARILNLMLLGDESAITLGYNINGYKQRYLIVSSIIVGFAVYAAGMIGFVGLIIPHIMRMLLGTDHKALIPTSALFGAIFMLWADTLCRVVMPNSELPIGMLISMVGAPFFLYLMLKHSYSFGATD